MARVDTLPHFLTDVADAIREKKGTQGTIQASNFDTEIASISGGGGLDWSAIGYSGTPQNITTDYNYSKNIYDNWDSTQTNLTNKFQNNNNLVYMPLVDTSNATNVTYMFNSCIYLIEVPSLDFSNVTDATNIFYNCQNLETVSSINFSKANNLLYAFYSCTNLKNVGEITIKSTSDIRGMFNGCNSLTDESLDNILQMCITATELYTKTLVNIGFNSTYYPSSRIQALPHYQDFIDAGWTIGY